MSKGILDINGDNINPLNNKEYSDDYKELAKIWSKFPAYKNAENTINDITNNQVILVVSGTGSGKTVLFPKFVLHSLDYNKKVAITLPKQIIAQSAAEFAAKTLDVKIGDEVGYQFRGNSKQSSKTKLLYATDGTIVARLLSDPELKDFDAVVIDEAHERKIQIDFLLYLLKNTLKLRPEFKLVIMSATINAGIFKTYFNEFKFKQIDISGGAHYPIKSHYLKLPITDREYINKGLEIIQEEILKKDPQDTLFFVTSVSETMKACNQIKNEKIFIDKEGKCIEVYSGVDSKKQEMAQSKTMYKEEGFKVKLVTSTNVAESSLTIDGIKYVVDSGFELNSYFDPDSKANRLDKTRITKAQVKQRMGRAGRTAPGVCYHLYTESEYNSMEEFPQPSIRVSDITNESLYLLKRAKTVDNLLKMYSDFIEPPREKYLKYSLDRLRGVRLIKNNELTPLGELVSQFSGFNYQQAMALICAIYFRCSQELLSVFSVLESCKNSIENLFNDAEYALEKFNLHSDKLQKLVKEQKAFVKKHTSAHGDHLSALNIYQAYRKKVKNKEQIDIFYSIKTLSSAMKRRQKMSSNIKIRQDDISDDIIRDLGLTKINDINKTDVTTRLMVCIITGFRQNLATKIRGKSLYEVNKTNVKYAISKDSYVKSKEPGLIIYDELFISSGKSEMKICSLIDSKIKKLI